MQQFVPSKKKRDFIKISIKNQALYLLWHYQSCNLKVRLLLNLEPAYDRVNYKYLLQSVAMKILKYMVYQPWENPE